MIKFVGLYFIGLIISVLFLKEAIIFINTNVFDAILVSTKVNDYFQLVIRIFLSYLFGAAYFFFKIQRLNIILKTEQIIFSMSGLIFMLIFINFLQVFITLKLLSKERIFIHSILSLWITFPCIILYFGMLLKYGFKRSDIKWFW